MRGAPPAAGEGCACNEPRRAAAQSEPSAAEAPAPRRSPPCINKYRILSHMYEEWISFLDRIDSDKFRNAFNRFIQLNIAYVVMTPIQKDSAFLLAMEQVNQEKNRLATCSTLISSISEQEYYHLEDALNARLYLEIPKVMPELWGNLDTLITTKIMSEEYMEMGNNEYAMIPIE